MKRKPIKIDWDDLEEAFSNLQAETSSYLDTITGHVVLDGEGEDDDLLDDDPAVAAAGATAAPPPADPNQLPIHPPDTATRIEWLKGFLGESSDVPAEITAELTAAMEDPDAARTIAGILNQNQEVRDAWYLYRSDCLHDMIDAWLEENEIEFTDPPPWS